MSNAGTPAEPYSLDEIAAMRLGHDRDGNVVAADRARLFVTADNALTEIARLEKIEARAKEQIAHHTNYGDDLPKHTAFWTAKWILKGSNDG